ncbi:ABC transporter ATP-binding protein [Luteolibacter pohnpeiensis]|uniref:ABC transporter ATP-binding protein n=1 Tax=Luteolibacter pohnpeiensis TaxID=454153 RepID=A0A934SCT0_9BACT|nr:ABC transporter ATP-binding protein [Luteolibacter pohnpeiensis]MBK1883767.1 ABC transporter ATP-binding protein [Luteolibacter pohnpeiensis]
MNNSINTVEIRDCGLILGHSGQEVVEFRLPEFQLKAREQVALTGPSGCGKSTLLNLVSGLKRPDAGEIHVAGRRIDELSTARMDAFRGREIGFVFQGFSLLGPFTALENVAIGLRFGSRPAVTERSERAYQLLEKVGLKDRINSRPDQLSMGERQRVAIARALSNRPQLLLADEPTAALDPDTASVVFDLIRSVCHEENCALLFVTHDSMLATKLPRQFDCRGLVHTRKEVAA